MESLPPGRLEARQLGRQAFRERSRQLAGAEAGQLGAPVSREQAVSLERGFSV